MATLEGSKSIKIRQCNENLAVVDEWPLVREAVIEEFHCSIQGFGSMILVLCSIQRFLFCVIHKVSGQGLLFCVVYKDSGLGFLFCVVYKDSYS